MQHFVRLVHRGGCMEATNHLPLAPDSVDDAMVALFHAERDGLVRMATLMVGSAAIAEEVVQDAFAGVAPRWESIDQPGAYLRRSVVNGCAQVLRRRDAERRAIDSQVPRPDVALPTRLIELSTRSISSTNGNVWWSSCATSSTCTTTTSPKHWTSKHLRFDRSLAGRWQS